MKNLNLFLKYVGLPLMLMGGLVACGEKSSSDKSDAAGASIAESSEQASEVGRPKLEEVIRGVWIAESPESLEGAVEKVQLDFRGDGEVTMIVFNPGENEPLDGDYEVKGDDLKIVFDQQDPVETKYDGKVLTVIDQANGQQVDFEKM